MTEADVRSYLDEREKAPFEEWVRKLDTHAQAKVIVAVTRLSLGNLSNVKAVGEGVAELKIHWGPGYRVYFGQDGPRLVILVGGGTKTRQYRDIAQAKLRWADYKARKKSRAM